MKAGDIKELNSLRKWLSFRPEELQPSIASVLAIRLALRALLTFYANYNLAPDVWSNFVARNFRTYVAAKVAVREQTDDLFALVALDANNISAAELSGKNQSPTYDGPAILYASRALHHAQKCRVSRRVLDIAKKEAKETLRVAEEAANAVNQAYDGGSGPADFVSAQLRRRDAVNKQKGLNLFARSTSVNAEAAKLRFDEARAVHAADIDATIELACLACKVSTSNDTGGLVLEELRNDAKKIEQGESLSDLSYAPLWRTSDLKELQSVQSKLADSLSALNGSKRPILLDWYDTVAAGKSAFGLPENIANEIEKRIALGDNRPDFWSRSFEEINTEIESWLTKEIAARHPENLPPLSLSQRPAPHSFDIEDGKIVAVATRSSIAPQSIADQVNAALLDKAKSAQKRLARTQAPEHYCRSIETLVSVLEANEKGIATGRLMMVSTSIESIARAIDSPDGRSEYGVDVVAEMNDLAASLDEFKALFPEVMKILAESLAHKLAVGNAVSVNIHINEIQQHAAHSTVVSFGAVEALREGDEDVARQTKIIESSADDEQRAAAIEARARTVSQRLLTVRNFVVRPMKSLVKRTGVSMGKGYDNAIEDTTEAIIKASIALFIANAVGPVAAIAAIILSWKPLAKRAEEIAKEHDPDDAQDI